MIKYICDKCGMVVENERGLYKRWSGSANVDLCDDCATDYDSAIKRAADEATKKWFNKH